MGQRFLGAMTTAMVLIGFAISGATPTAAPPKVPRTPWGKPDLEGTWDFRTITPLERPDKLAGREFLTEEEAAKLEKEVVDRNTFLDERPAEEAPVGGNVDRRADGSPGFYNNFWLDGGTKPVATRRTSLIIDPSDGKLPPLTEEGKRRAEARRAYLREHPADTWEDLGPSLRCLVGFNAGPPLSPGGYNQNMQVFQTRDYVALLTEMVHTGRIVPLDGRSRLSQDIHQWSGDARGHWDGDTLVLESANFRADRGWRGSSEEMKLIERLTRVDVDTLEYTYTVTDPKTWTRPWTASIPLRRSNLPLYEYACHEGNYSMTNVLAGARTMEKRAGHK